MPSVDLTHSEWVITQNITTMCTVPPTLWLCSFGFIHTLLQRFHLCFSIGYILAIFLIPSLSCLPIVLFMFQLCIHTCQNYFFLRISCVLFPLCSGYVPQSTFYDSIMFCPSDIFWLYSISVLSMVPSNPTKVYISVRNMMMILIAEGFRQGPGSGGPW